MFSPYRPYYLADSDKNVPNKFATFLAHSYEQILWTVGLRLC